MWSNLIEKKIISEIIWRIFGENKCGKEYALINKRPLVISWKYSVNDYVDWIFGLITGIN